MVKVIKKIKDKDAIHIWKLAFGMMVGELFNDKFHNDKFEVRGIGTDEKPKTLIVEVNRILYCEIDDEFNIVIYDDDNKLKRIKNQVLIQNFFIRESYYSF